MGTGSDTTIIWTSLHRLANILHVHVSCASVFLQRHVILTLTVTCGHAGTHNCVLLVLCLTMPVGLVNVVSLYQLVWPQHVVIVVLSDVLELLQWLPS
jgi:hypothetical protein